jgi:hypothetical protein
MQTAKGGYAEKTENFVQLQNLIFRSGEDVMPPEANGPAASVLSAVTQPPTRITISEHSH